MSLQKSYRLFGRSIFSLLFLGTINAGFAEAQVIPDGTLPTTVEQLGNMDRITGGERVGNNLFHSFEQFSIPEGMEAIFENGLDIQNIFTRVTGSEASLIDGLLKTAGGANFFLINPNGIVFGQNARLDIGGSFIATTADRVEFSDGNTFSARSQEKPLLTWNAPIGLGLDYYSQFRGGIAVNGSGNQITPSFSSTPTQVADNQSGLSVNPGKTLALIGNGISVNGGTITTEGGLIELGSVDSGSVSFQEVGGRFNFNYDNISSYQDIDLTNLSVLNVSGESSGGISLNGKNIAVSNGSLFLNQNQGNTPSGTININSSDSLIITGTSPDGNVSSDIRSEAVSSGKGADINISTGQIVLRDGGRIGATTYSDAQGGDISINSTESIQLLENTEINPERQNFVVNGISAVAFRNGNAGNLQLSTSNLKITSGSSIQSSAARGGNSGNLTINAEIIEIIGVNQNPQRRSQSALTSSVNSGNAGDLTIKTSELKILDGGILSSSTFGNGNAGNVIINASESVEVSGKNNNLPSSINSSVIPLTNEAARQRLGIPDVPSGNGGSLTIKTPLLKVAQEGVVSVGNFGLGSAGTLAIDADTLNLDQTGSITANVSSGIGGDITLNTQNLNISNDSQITTNAGNNQNGGNITINTTNLTAKKNGDITANALEGDGGNIEITAADTISLNDGSDITAASSLGNGGNITLDADQIQLLDNSNLSASAGGDGNGGNVTTFSNTFLAGNSDVTATAVRGDGGNILIDSRTTIGIAERDAEPDNGTSDADASSEFGRDGDVTITNPQNSSTDPLIAAREPENPNLDLKENKGCYIDEEGNVRNRTIVYTGRISQSADNFADGEIYVPAPGFVPPPEVLEEEKNREEWSDDPWGEYQEWQPGDPIIDSNAIRVDENGDVYAVAEMTPQAARNLLCTPKLTEAEEEIKN